MNIEYTTKRGSMVVGNLTEEDLREFAKKHEGFELAASMNLSELVDTYTSSTTITEPLWP